MVSAGMLEREKLGTTQDEAKDNTVRPTIQALKTAYIGAAFPMAFYVLQDRLLSQVMKIPTISEAWNRAANDNDLRIWDAATKFTESLPLPRLLQCVADAYGPSTITGSRLSEGSLTVHPLPFSVEPTLRTVLGDSDPVKPEDVVGKFFALDGRGRIDISSANLGRSSGGLGALIQNRLDLFRSHAPGDADSFAGDPILNAYREVGTTLGWETSNGTPSISGEVLSSEILAHDGEMASALPISFVDFITRRKAHVGITEGAETIVKQNESLKADYLERPNSKFDEINFAKAGEVPVYLPTSGVAFQELVMAGGVDPREFRAVNSGEDRGPRTFGSDAERFSNTLAEWTRRSGLTEEEFFNSVRNAPEAWAHLGEVSGETKDYKWKIAENAEMVYRSNLTVTAARAIRVHPCSMHPAHANLTRHGKLFHSRMLSDDRFVRDTSASVLSGELKLVFSRDLDSRLKVRTPTWSTQA
jgi:hypothetical protein